MKIIPTEKIEKFLGRMKKREKLFLYGASLMIAFAFSDQVIVRPIAGTFRSSGQELQDLRTEIKRTMRILSQKDRIMKQIGRDRMYAAHTGSEEEEMLSVLEHIEELAAKAAVNLLFVKPAGVKTEGITKKYYVALQCEGQTMQVATFFHELESSPRLLKIEKYAIQPARKKSSILKATATIFRAAVG